mgnify:FL=1
MYRSFLSVGLMAMALFLNAQSYVHQVVVLNEGYYDHFGGGGQIVPVTLGGFDPASGTYMTLATLVGPRFASDVLVDAGSIYVAADDRVLRFDADSYAQTGEALVQGVRKLAVWNEQLVITRGELGGLDHYLEVRDKNSLDLLYTVTPADGLTYSAEDILVHEDKAYLAVNNAFDWTNVVGRVGVLDLVTGTYDGGVDLGPDGTNPERLMVYDGDIIAFNNTDFTRSSISRVALASNTLAYTTTVSLNSGCATSLKVGAVDKVYYMEYEQGELARFDLATGTVSDTLVGSPSVYGLIDDPINGVLYGTTTDFTTMGELHVMDLNGQVQSTVPVSVAPGNLALDTRSAASVDDQNGVSFGLYPNPAQDHITITGSNLSGNVRILDTTGRVVVEHRVNNDQARTVIAVDALPTGVYMVTITGQGTLMFAKD